MNELSYAWLKELRSAQDLSDRQFRLLVILSTYTDGDLGSAWPSRKTLAEHLQCSVRTVTSLMSALEKAGYVVSLHSRGGRPNEWRLTLESERQPGNAELRGSSAEPGNPGLPGSYPQPSNFRAEPGNFRAEPGNPGLQPISYQRSERARERPSGRARDAVDGPTCVTCGRPESSCRAVAEKTGDTHRFSPSKEAHHG